MNARSNHRPTRAARRGRLARELAVAVLSSALLGGCAYTEAEVALAGQARKGLTLIRHAHADHAALAGRLHEAQRVRLDAAFDADVRDAADLSPAWVIEARRAYAAGVDALNQQRAASAGAAATAARNVEAIDTALERLELLQRSRLKVEQSLLPEKP